MQTKSDGQVWSWSLPKNHPQAELFHKELRRPATPRSWSRHLHWRLRQLRLCSVPLRLAHSALQGAALNCCWPLPMCAQAALWPCQGDAIPIWGRASQPRQWNEMSTLRPLPTQASLQAQLFTHAAGATGNASQVGATLAVAAEAAPSVVPGLLVSSHFCDTSLQSEAVKRSSVNVHRLHHGCAKGARSLSRP